MSFITKLAVERAVAGGVKQRPEPDRAQFMREPAIFMLENLYFKSRLPKYTRALTVSGNCVGPQVNDGDIVLFSHKIGYDTIEQGDLVVLRADDMYPDIDFHTDWKCLRKVEGRDDNGALRVSSMSDDDQQENQTADASSYCGKAVFAFSA